MSTLADKKCVPCEGDMKPLTKEEAQEYLKDMSDWELVENDTKIKKRFSFSDFKGALSFVNAVGEIAEFEGHHPDLFLHDYKNVTVSLSTHAVGGLSENDLIMAAKIDANRQEEDYGGSIKP